MPPSNSLGNIPTVTSFNAAWTATEDNLDSTLGHSQTDNTARMCNLLPSLGQTKEATQSVGVYIGEGLLPVPAKLAEKLYDGSL